MASGPLGFLRASDILDRGIREGCRCCPPQPPPVVALSSLHLEDMARKKCAGKVGPINKTKGITSMHLVPSYYMFSLLYEADDSIGMNTSAVSDRKILGDSTIFRL